jgi:antirestriction protein ArdC
MDLSLKFSGRKVQNNNFTPNKGVESLMESFGIKPKFYKRLSDITYNYTSDEMKMLYPEYFCKNYYYYALLHEIIHWTGYTTRTGRSTPILVDILGDTLTDEKDRQYAIIEEAIANIGSFLLCQHYGIEVELEVLVALLIMESDFGLIPNGTVFLKSILNDILTALEYLQIKL